MSNSFAQKLTGQTTPTGLSGFVEKLSEPKPKAPEFAKKALRGERLNALDSLSLEISALGYQIDRYRPVETASKIGRLLHEIAEEQKQRPELMPRKDRDGRVIGVKSKPGIYADLEALVQRLQDEQHKRIGTARESISSNNSSRRQVRLVEQCSLESRNMCSCRRCIGNHA